LYPTPAAGYAQDAVACLGFLFFCLYHLALFNSAFNLMGLDLRKAIYDTSTGADSDGRNL
jgi:hypothetical protein